MAEIELDRRQAAAGRLPRVCVYCGARADGYRTKLFYGTAPYKRFLFHRPRVALPVCAAHRGFTLRRSLLLVPPLVLFIAALALVSALSGKGGVAEALAPLVPLRGVFIALALLLFGLLLGTILFVFYGDVRCKRLTTRTITLANVSEAFVDACTGAVDELETVEEVPTVLPADAPPRPRRRRPVETPEEDEEPPPAAIPWVWIVLGLVVALSCLGCGGAVVLVVWLFRGRRR